MGKWTVAIFIMYFICAVVSAIAEGGGGINTTDLTANESADDATLNVTSTTGFLNADYVWIGNEKILYTGKTGTTFTGCTRGYDDTTAVSHASGSYVYSEASNVMNAAMGFNLAELSSAQGIMAIPTMVWQFLTVSVPRVIIWDFGFLKEGFMQYIRYALLCLSIGFIVMLTWPLVSAIVNRI